MKKTAATFSAMLCAGILTSAALSCSSGPNSQDPAKFDEAAKEAQRQAASQLLEKLELAKLNGDKLFEIPKGEYRFSKPLKKGAHSSFIPLEKINGLTIDGAGSTFWLESEARAFHIVNCSKLTIKNLKIDWDPAPFVQGTIVAADPKNCTLDVKLDPGFETSTKAFMELPPEKSDKFATVRGIVADAKEPKFKAAQNGFRVVPFFQTPKIGDAYRIKILTFYERPLDSVNAKIGDKIVLMNRKEGGILTEGSSGIVFEDIAMSSCPGLHFVEGGCYGERNVYRRCKILPRPGTESRLGGVADGFHSQNCEYGPLIEDCYVESIVDDAVNIHGFYRKVVAQKSPTEVVVENLAWRKELKPNCSVDFYSSPEKGLEHQGSFKVLSARFENGKHVLTLDKPTNVEPGSICSIEDYSGQGGIVRNCHFKNVSVRGVLCKSHDILIEGNTMEWMGSWGVILTTEAGYWGESALPHDVKIKGNTITDAGINGKASAIGLVDPTKDLSKAKKISNVEIIGNTLERSAGPSITLRGTRNVRIEGNKISGDHTVYSNEFGEGMSQDRNEKTAAIALEGVEGLIEDGNQIDAGAGKPIGEEKAAKRD